MNNDYELVYLAQEYNEDASEILYKKYKTTLTKIIDNIIFFIIF